MRRGGFVIYNSLMTTQSLAKALKSKKPAVIRERGLPRFVVLDWDAYRAWEEMREDMEDHIRFEIAERESRGQKRYTFRVLK